MPKRISRVEIVAEEAIKLIDKGDNSPRIETLWSSLRKSGLPVPGSLDEISEFLRQCRTYLAVNYEGISCCCISNVFYQEQKDAKGKIIRKSFKDKPPESIDEGFSCLPGMTGPDSRIAGLYFAVQNGSTHDYIIEASILRLHHQSARESALADIRTVDAIDNKVVNKRRILASRSRIRRDVAQELGEDVMKRLVDVIGRATSIAEDISKALKAPPKED